MMEKERKQVLEIINSDKYDYYFIVGITRLSKNSASSEEVRKLGNTMFNREFHDLRSHRGAWNFYTISISTAELNSEALAMAYGNRSALLIHLSKYDDCLKDINRALAITKNSSFRVKLLLRKAKCLYCLDSMESHTALKKAAFLVNQITDTSVKKVFEDNVEKTRILLKKYNATVPARVDRKPKILEALVKKHQINDFSSVEIQYNEQYGRHLVAAKDIRIGDVIFIEKPYIQCINLANMNMFCAHCFTVCWSNIPCDHCSWAMFCSEECIKKDAWEKYHDIECSVWAVAKQRYGNGTPQQLALRAIILGLKEYGSLENIQTALKAFDERTDINKGFMHDRNIQPSGLMAMYFLSRDISKKSLKSHKVETARALKSVGMNTTWLGNNFDHSQANNYKNNENATLFGTLFLTFSKIGQINGRQMWNHRANPCKQPTDPTDVLCSPKLECCSAGYYLAPVTSLLNHRCWPNARVCWESNNTVIVYATQPIKKGEQIFDCYSLQFHEGDIAKRQKILSRTYNMECKCTPCQEKWPFREELANFSEKNLRQYPLEKQLFQKNSKILLPSMSTKKADYDEKIISTLKKEIEKALKNIPQPSFTTASLIHSLQKAYEVVYGISVDIPEKCNNI